MTNERALSGPALWFAAAVAAACSLVLSACAVGNKAELVLMRNISFGQEMIDLKEARDVGALTEAEYLELKTKLMELVDLEGVVEIIDGAKELDFDSEDEDVDAGEHDAAGDAGDTD